MNADLSNITRTLYLPTQHKERPAKRGTMTPYGKEFGGYMASDNGCPGRVHQVIIAVYVTALTIASSDSDKFGLRLVRSQTSELLSIRFRGISCHGWPLRLHECGERQI